MAVKGTIAKENVVKKIQEAFGNAYLGAKDNKHYVLVNDGENGDIQIAISMTAPKVGLETEKKIEFVGVSEDAPPAAISKEEKENIAALLESLGL